MATPVDAAKFVAMAHQVGGHATEKTSLRAFGGQILKPFQSKQRGEREHEFYARIFADGTTHDNATYQQLRSLLPGYRGLVVVADETAESELHPGKYLALEDLTWGRKWPCIMDVKVGTRSYEDGASDEKIAYERTKFPLQTRVGFRVQGIKVYDPMTQSYKEYDKHVGRGITTESDLVQLFAKFFAVDNAGRAQRLLQAFITRLTQFQQWYEAQDELEFIASSLLFLYDGDHEGDNGGHADIRLIDFAHVQYTTPATRRRDEGVLLGVTTLRAIFQQLLAQLSGSE